MTSPTTSYGAIDDHTQPTSRRSNPSSLRNQEINETPDKRDENHLLRFSASQILENKGSVARDHMANERTFLAWLRTSLAFITIGIGVTQLLRMDGSNSTAKLKIVVDKPVTFKFGKTIGSIFIIIGILSLVFGCQRYFEVQYMLTRDKYPAARLGIIGLLVLVFSITLVTFYMVGKVHGSLARAGKVKSQTPKVEKQEKPKKPQGRAYVRLLYTRRFVNVTLTNGKRKMNPSPASK
ncbi:40S ribosomal protein S30-B [Spathaspora sp. JA1]|nr:40S ribosomal protein S30-B [Spathaspora sp. JA1]